MRVFSFSPETATPIELFESERVSSVPIATGSGEVHVYAVHYGTDGIIGTHPTGFCQIFLVVHGEGWAAGEDGKTVPLGAGQGVHFEHGENHSKGGSAGMIAIMVQATQLQVTDLV